MYLDLASAVILAAFESTRLNARERDFFCRFPIAGVTLFRWNITPDLTLLRSCLSSIQFSQHNSAPIIVAIDQEGGRVTRMPRGFPNLGPPLFIAKQNPMSQETLAQIFQYGEKVGRELKQAGINVNFAPVLDIFTNPANTAIGDRAWGADAQSVASRAGAYLAGLQASAVRGCLKHFPGQGDAPFDTHLSSASIHLSQNLLLKREMRPFINLLSMASMVMISHCIYSDFDHLPASLSYKIQTDLLKKRLAFKGLVLSDDMNMKAISQDLDEWTARVVQAIAAGTDLVLICKDVERIEYAIQAIAKEARRSVFFANRLREAAEKVQKFRYTLC